MACGCNNNGDKNIKAYRNKHLQISGVKSDKPSNTPKKTKEERKLELISRFRKG